LPLDAADELAVAAAAKLQWRSRAVLDNGVAQSACSARDSATTLLGAIRQLWHRYNMDCLEAAADVPPEMGA
jgi:hypothetical protein